MLGFHKSTLRRRMVAAGAVLLLATSCGARVQPYLGVSAGGGPAAAGTGPGQSTGGAVSAGQGATATTVAQAAGPTGGAGAASQAAGSSTATSVAAGPRTGAAQNSASAAPTPSGLAALTPANFSYDPRVQASYCTGSAGNTASAPGVTPTTITAGNVSGISGAVSDSFEPGSQAVEAVFDSINRYGGICGRQLKLTVEDDQQSSSSNSADVQALIPKVLAFVGSLSDADNGGVSAMEAAGTPDMGPAININRSNSSVFWSATGGSVTVRNGHAFLNNAWLNGLKANGELPKSIAILSYSIPISAQAGQEYATVFQSEGVSICYTNYAIPPAPGAQMGSVVATMQQKNCDGVFTTMDVVGNGVMLRDMAADGYHPKLISTTYEGYTPDQISQAGGSKNAQGLDIGLSSVPLTAAVPGVQMYTQEMATYQPGRPLTAFGLASWADAELYVYALLKAGRNPTRASLTQALSQVTNWTSDGAFGAYTPSQRSGPPCSTNVVYRGSAFTLTWPSSGLYCNGQLVDVGPAS
ncbi:MAG TPA: ABC transporter substrate-binding protein [Acidimicrobiales bacterium]|nr:ABC transporter substrate-binding protein [Acidimicrobiales bacterium]